MLTRMSPKMHADEVHTDVELVRRLLTGQFPRWAGLPLAPVPSAGTDNALYRLGTDLAVRLPRIAGAAGDVERSTTAAEARATAAGGHPRTAREGEPGEGYPWSWSVYRWLDGENPAVDRLADPDAFAAELAEFVTALHRIDPAGGPPRRPWRAADRRDEPTRTRSTRCTA